MSKADYLAAYVEGWAVVDSDKILSALADSFVLDDPNHGRVTKSELTAYVEGVKSEVNELRGGQEEAHLLEFSDVLTDDRDGELITWCWWRVPGTSIEGGALIKVSDEGVISERLTYYTKVSA